MMNKWAFCTSVALLSLSFSLAFGQPFIQSQDGSWADRSTMTLNGGNFGSKIPAAPVLWDPVDGVPAYSGLSHGEDVPTQKDGCNDCPWWWVVSTTYRPTYYETGPGLRVPGKAVYMADKSGAFQGLELEQTGNDPVVYFSWWVMATKDLRDQGLGPVYNKLLRFWSDPSGERGRTSWEVYFTQRRISDGAGDLTPEQYPYAGWGFLGDNEWSNIEATIYNNNIDAYGGGQLTLDVDNVRLMTTPEDLASLAGPYDYVKAIGSNPHDKTRYEAGTYVYFGDIYIDTTVARVVIGNASTYSACTHKEVQIPVEWSENQISFTANTGSFAPGDPIWFYVFNEDNQYNENGWELNQEPVEGPGQPGQPVIN